MSTTFDDFDDDGDTREAPVSKRMPRKSREQTARPRSWQPPSVLPEPDKEPGYAYRWVRVSSLGQTDPRNMSAKLREGWEPVRLEEQPHFSMLVDPSSRFKDNIEVAGLLLCKCPSEFMDQRREYIANQTQAQIDSVDNNFMRESDPRMPLFRERKTRTSFGRG